MSLVAFSILNKDGIYKKTDSVYSEIAMWVFLVKCQTEKQLFFFTISRGKTSVTSLLRSTRTVLSNRYSHYYFMQDNFTTP